MSNIKNPVSAGLCKRCGKVGEFTSITYITKQMHNSCMSLGVSRAAEMRESILRSSRHCKDCAFEIRHAKIKKLLSLPKLIYKKLT